MHANKFLKVLVLVVYTRGNQDMCIIQLIIFIAKKVVYMREGEKEILHLREIFVDTLANSSFNCQNMRFGTSLRVKYLFLVPLLCEMQYTSGDFLNNEMSGKVPI